MDRKLEEALQRLLRARAAADALTQKLNGVIDDLLQEPCPPTRAARYSPSTKRWICPGCNKFTNLHRRAVTTHMRFCEDVAKGTK
jgi:hypothetical protein